MKKMVAVVVLVGALLTPAFSQDALIKMLEVDATTFQGATDFTMETDYPMTLTVSISSTRVVGGTYSTDFEPGVDSIDLDPGTHTVPVGAYLSNANMRNQTPAYDVHVAVVTLSASNQGDPSSAPETVAEITVTMDVGYWIMVKNQHHAIKMQQMDVTSFSGCRPFGVENNYPWTLTVSISGEGGVTGDYSTNFGGGINAVDLDPGSNMVFICAYLSNADIINQPAGNNVHVATVTLSASRRDDPSSAPEAVAEIKVTMDVPYLVRAESGPGGTADGEIYRQYWPGDQPLDLCHVTPDPGYVFTGWTGRDEALASLSPHPDDPSLWQFDGWHYWGTLGQTEQVYLLATFAPESLNPTLTVSSTDGGQVSSPGEGSFQYDEGTTVSIWASAQSGFVFTGWTGTAVSAGKVANPSSSSTTVVIDADYTLMANFEADAVPQKRTLTLSSTSGGRVSSPGEGTFEYDHGSMVVITATADPGYRFTHWSGTMWSTQDSNWMTIDQDHDITANFERLPDEPLPPSTSIHLAASMVSAGKAALSWNEVSGATGYQLERREQSSQEWTDCGTFGPDVTASEDTGLASDTRYYYRLKALFDIGYFLYSRIASFHSAYIMMPWIDGIDPASPLAIAPRQPVVIHGRNLDEATVCLYDLDTSEAYCDPEILAGRDKFHIPLRVGLGTSPGNWAVEVTNPDGRKARHSFRVTMDGLETLFGFIDNDPGFPDPQSRVQNNQIAYMLATVQGETGVFGPIAEDEASWRGRSYGEEDPETEERYYGRGYVQITKRVNYKKFSFTEADPESGFKAYLDDLLSNLETDIDSLLGRQGEMRGNWLHLENDPNLVVEKPEIAYAIMSYGMRNGMFRPPHTLELHIDENKTDYVGAREIIQPVKHWFVIGKYDEYIKQLKIAEKIAGYAKQFETMVAMKYLTTPSTEGYSHFDGGMLTCWSSSGSGQITSCALSIGGSWAGLTTESPITLYQPIATPAEPFELSFDYWFTTAGGTLDVMLDSVVLATIDAPDMAQDEPHTLSVLVPDTDLLGREDVVLAFWLDGPTGSQVLLNNVQVAAPQVSLQPVAHWAFDEGTGNVASDSVGDNHGHVRGPVWADGAIGTALRFDGIDDYVDCGSAEALAPETMTLAFWTYAGMPPSDQYIVAKAPVNGAWARDYTVCYRRTGQIEFYFGDHQGSVRVTTTARIAEDTWVHVAVVRDGMQALIYINGQLEANRAYAFVPVNRMQPLTLGALSPSVPMAHFKGMIDEVRLYDQALTADEILSLYLAELP